MSQLRSTIALVALLVGAAADGQEVLKRIDSKEGWKVASQKNGITIYSRVRAGSPIKEFKAIGEIDAPTPVVYAVIADFENYPQFMPYTAECRLLKREGDTIIGYQRLSPKIAADRDYALRVRTKSWPSGDGTTYLNWWSAANEHAPAERPGVVRVKICDGGWLLEPQGRAKTRATYSVYTDTGGLIPPFVANHVSQIGIARLYDAVRKQARDPKYKAKEEGGRRKAENG